MTLRTHIGHTLMLVITVLWVEMAQADEIRVLTTGGFEAPYRELIAGCERATGHRIVTMGTSMGVGENSIPNRLRRGEPADVVVLSTSSFTELVNEGRIVAESRVPLARSAIGMAVPKRGTQARHQFGRGLQACAPTGEVDCVFGTNQRHLSLNGAVPAAWNRRPARGEEPQNRT